MSDPHRRTPEEVRREIAATRDQLADTAAALAAKADVKERARERVDEVKEGVRSRVTEVKDTVSEKAHDVRGRLPGAGDAPATGASAGSGGMAGTVPHAPMPDPTAGTTGLGAKAASAGHVAGEAATAAKQQVRSHPLPSAAIAAALLGFVLGYLLARR